MDPVTAVGFAASILTFIDFSWNLIAGAYEVYQSTTGTTAENAHISTVIDDLQEITEGLNANVEGKAKHEKALYKLADNCHDLSQDLSKILEKLKVTEKNSKWQSLKVKWASMRKEREVASIEKRLDGYRSQILLQLNFMLCKQQSSIKTQLDKIQKEGLQLSTESANQFTCLRKELQQAVQELLKKPNKEDVETIRNDGVEQIKSLTEIRFSLSKLQLMTKSMSQENRILRRLYFESMYAREDAIAEAASGTFGWILEERDDNSSEAVKYCSSESEDAASEGKSSIHREEDETSTYEERSRDITESLGALEEKSQSDDAASFAVRQDYEELSQIEREMRKRTRDTFLTWLKSGGQIYHISGKAGSGKSTLMKFLCQHSRVQQELDSWAGDKKLVFAHFFFWNSGDKLQMSLEGLYRAILFETLKQYPELIPEIFPDQWDVLESEEAGFESTLFRFPKIKAVFNTLIGKRTFPKHRFCFFIDGLDEYEGDSLDHWKLAESLQNWADSEDIKVCVSSRPHTEFLDTFSDNSSLRIHLHELTRGDISRFALAMFEKDRNFNRISDSYLDLVDDVVNMANGVFLWARLVVRSLLSGVGHNDSTSVLKEKLKATPKGLDDLFDKLLSAIDPSDRKRSDIMLLIATLTPHGKSLNALTYSWLEDLGDPNFPFSLPVQGYSDEEIKKRHEDLRRQLDSLSKGLLEMTSTSYSDLFFKRTVQFFHRTVRDYIQDNSRLNQIKSRLPGFDITEAYFRLFLAEFKFARTQKNYLEEEPFATRNPFFRRFLDTIATMQV